MMFVVAVEGSTDDFQSMTIEKLSEEEHSHVEVLKTGRQTVFEERITRVEETEREVIEEKSIRKFMTFLLREALKARSWWLNFVHLTSAR